MTKKTDTSSESLAEKKAENIDKQENIKDEHLDHRADAVVTSISSDATLKRKILFWCVGVIALFFLFASLNTFWGIVLTIGMWSVVLYILYRFAFLGEYNWVFALSAFIVVALFSFFVVPHENNDENSIEKENLAQNVQENMSILAQLKQSSTIPFEEIKQEQITDFEENGEYVTYTGESMMARNVETSLIEKEVHAFFEDAGFEVRDIGGVGGMQSLGGEVYMRGSLSCRTMYGRGSTITALTVTCNREDK